MFETVARDACERNYDGRRLDKRPDLAFRLVGSRDPFAGWFVECKIVDARHAARLYVQHGIQRYVGGDYAWAMPSALLIAYVGPGCAIATTLAAALPAGDRPGRVEALSGEADVWRTTHARPWCYPDTTRNPGDICLFHLWLAGAVFEPLAAGEGSGRGRPAGTGRGRPTARPTAP